MPEVVLPVPPVLLAVPTVAADVALSVVIVEFVAPPTPLVLVVLVTVDELVVELPDVVVDPLVLPTALPVVTAAAVSEPVPLTAPDES